MHNLMAACCYGDRSGKKLMPVADSMSETVERWKLKHRRNYIEANLAVASVKITLCL